MKMFKKWSHSENMFGTSLLLDMFSYPPPPKNVKSYKSDFSTLSDMWIVLLQDIGFSLHVTFSAVCIWLKGLQEKLLVLLFHPVCRKKLGTQRLVKRGQEPVLHVPAKQRNVLRLSFS